MSIINLHSKTWHDLHAMRSKLPHALMLSAQTGCGAFELAEVFVAALLCERGAINNASVSLFDEAQTNTQNSALAACGECPACHWLADGNHPDFRLLQPAALDDNSSARDDVDDTQESTVATKKAVSWQITIDQVRSLDDFMNVGTHRHGLRIILICPAEAMNRNAANALLKMLEEPPRDTLFLIVAHELARILPTIRSRSRIVALPAPEPAMLEHYLSQHGVTDAAYWLALAGNAPLLAVDLAKNAEEEWLLMLLKSLAAGKNSNPFVAAGSIDALIKKHKASNNAQHLRQIVIWAQKWIIDLTLCAAMQPVRYFLREQTSLQTLAKETNLPRLIRFFRSLNIARRETEQALNNRLFLESLLLSYQALFKA